MHSQSRRSGSGNQVSSGDLMVGEKTGSGNFGEFGSGKNLCTREHVAINGNGSPKEGVRRSQKFGVSHETRNGTEAKNVIEVDDYEYDIQVKEVDGWFKIWDSRRSPSSNSVHYNLSVVIVSAEELSSLIRSPSAQVRYYFEFSLLGKTIRTKSFEVTSVPGPIDLPVEKITFKVAPSDFDILKKYFELISSFEIAFRSDSSTIASVTIPLTNLYINSNGPSPVVGEFNLTPINPDNQDNHDNNAVIGVYVALEKITQEQYQDQAKDRIATTLSSDSSLSSSPLTSPERSLISRSKLRNRIFNDRSLLNKRTSTDNVATSIKCSASEKSSAKDVPHQYCLSIDIRNIRSINPAFNWSKSPFLIQYSYAFFGPTTKIKTSAVNVINDELINFENGFFTFNFVTTESQLRETFESIALILELIEVSNKAIIRGISHVNLLDLIESEESDKRKLFVTKPIITDYNDDRIAQVTVIFSLQDIGAYQNGNNNGLLGSKPFEGNFSDINSDSDSIPFGPNVNSTSIFEAATGKTNLNQITMNNSIFNQIDHLFIEAALEIEAWKQAQVKLFKEVMKKKEKKMTERKIQELSAIEQQLKESLKKVALKEQMLDETRSRIESEAGKRTSEEIAKVRRELEQLKLVIEQKCGMIEELEAQNQQLKGKLLSAPTASSSLSSRTGSISRATGSKVRGSLISERESTISKKKPESKDFVLRTSTGFTRNNSLPSSVRSASKFGRTVSSTTSSTTSKASTSDQGAREEKPVPPKTPSRTTSILSTGSVRWKSSATTPSATSCQRSSLVSSGGRTGKGAVTEKDRKSQLLEQLRNERNTMIKNGLCRSDDPMIKSIEKELKRHGVKSTIN